MAHLVCPVISVEDRQRLAAVLADRMMAKAAGLSLRTVQRIWAAYQLQPHRLRSFKRSRDPEFITKLADIVGLYLAPPRHAVVLSVDEKSHVWMAPGLQGAD